MTITLAAASTIQGVAGSATAITATIFGDEISTSDAFKKLYQNQLPSSAGVLYTVPALTQTIIKAISLVNTTAGAVTVVLFTDGTAAANRIVNLTVPANGFATYDADGWKIFDSTGQQLFVGATGATGPAGSTGTAGTNGWSPTLAVVSNGGTGFVFQIVGWVGGTGSPPSSTNQFIGASGIVGTAAAAQDIRGPAGASVLAFGIITGNSGTANADASPDTIAITGTGDITTAATDTPDGLVISTTPASALKISAHYYAFGDFGIVGDWNVTFDGTCAVGAPTKITSATAAFTTADVGKQITLSGAGAAGVKYVGTITVRDSATQVTVSPSISTTVTNQGMNWGTNNDTAWTNAQSTVNALLYPGVIIEFERTATNRYGQAVRCNWTVPVILQGQGRSYNADAGTYWQTGGTCIAWVASSSDAGTPFGGMHAWHPTGAFNIKGGGYRDIWFDCRNGDQAQALWATKFASVNGFSIRDTFIMDALAFGLWMDIDSTPSEQQATARGTAYNMGFRQLDNPAGAQTTPVTTSSAVTLTASGQSLTVAANSFPAAGYGWIMSSGGRPVLFQYTGGGGTTTLTGCRISAEDAIWAPATVSGSNVVPAYPGNGSAALLSGNTTANTNLSDFRMWQVSHGSTWGPAGIEYANADSLSMAQIVTNGGNATNDGAINRIRKPGIRFNGHPTNLGMACRNVSVYDGDAGTGGVSTMALLNTGARMTAPAGPNYWQGYQLGNGAGIPVTEVVAATGTQGPAGGSFLWTPNGGLPPGLRNQAGAGQVYTASTLTYIPGSLIAVPPQGFQVGTVFRWTFLATKTAAGTANRVMHVRIGANGSSTDGIANTITVATTAAADTGIISVLSIVTAIGASANITAVHSCLHPMTATGLATTAATVGAPTAFNSVSSGILYASLWMTSGALEALSSSNHLAEVLGGGAPY